MTRPWNKLIAALALAALAASAVATEAPSCERHSPAHTVALLELYTSEGCSSCPVADRFVRGLYASGFSANQVVPLSLHVDYWDSLGWRDRFASPQFTQRQYWLAAAARERTVYTPEIFLAGHEDRDWRDGDFQETVRAINGRAARAQITLTEHPAPPGAIAVDAAASVGSTARGEPLALFFAVYESDLVSEVRAGENRGATLRHGFVVRQWSAPLALDAQGNAMLHWQQNLPADARLDHLGFVAFVENTQTGEVLQTLALPSCAAP